MKNASGADWAGITPPGNVNKSSLLPLLRDAATPWRSAILIEHLGALLPEIIDSQGIRTSRYLYNEYVNGDQELYDLQLDPFELNHVVNDPANAAIVANLRATLALLKIS